MFERAIGNFGARFVRAFVSVLCAGFVAASPVLGATIKYFEVTGIADKVIALGDGTLLFADAHGPALSRYDPVTGKVTDINLGTLRARNPTLGADGRIWFTIDGDRRIGRYTMALGLLDLFVLPDNIAGSFGGMVLGLDGSLWATATDSGRILRIAPTGLMSTYDLPSFDPRPLGITQGPDGHLWFAESNARKIGRITSSGTVTEFAVPPQLTTSPSAIARGVDGGLWFATNDGFGRTAINGEMTVYPTGSQSATGAIAVEPNGSVWLASGGDVIQFVPPASVSRLKVFEQPAVATGLLFDSLGNLYVTDASLRQFGRVAVVAAGTSLQSGDTRVVEFYNNLLNHFFITANAGEAAAIEAGGAGPGWSRTGESWFAWLLGPMPATEEICRFYGNPMATPSGQRAGPNSHFYTFQGPECEQVKRDIGWLYEAPNRFFAIVPIGGECPRNSLPIYRTYNGRAALNDSNHRYMTRSALYFQMLALGWTGEGIVMCEPNHP